MLVRGTVKPAPFVQKFVSIQDAVVRKFTESPALLLMGGVLGFLLFAPLVLSLWRFALFGLD